MKNNSNVQNSCLAALLAGGAILLLTTLPACNREQPQVVVVPAPAAAQPAPGPSTVVAVQPEILAQDDYVYYPEYGVYFSNNRHQYVYQEGNAWVSRPQPPQFSASIVLASPSVHMDFHDSPAAHHADVVRSNPRKNAAPDRGRDGRGPGG